MKLRTIGIALGVLGAAVCVQLGVWQLSLAGKQRLNTEIRAALQGPRCPSERHRATDRHRAKPGQAHGRFDESRQILIVNRPKDGSPGVEVVTPLLIGPREAILVDRGWLYAGDAATAAPQDYPEPGEHTVVGIAQPLIRGRKGVALRQIDGVSLALWSMRWLDPDSLATRLPYRLASFSIRQLPGPDVPERPSRSVPTAYNEMMHLSYAIQWFLFAFIMLGGSLLMARCRTPTVPDRP
jgi:cytochrome oxidase assembly protein ShyY1